MPEIVGYQRSAALPANLNIGRVSADAFGANIGQAVGAAAQVPNQQIDFLIQKEETNARNHAANVAAEAEVFYNQRIQAEFNSPEFATKYGADGGNFAKTMLSDVTEYERRTLEQAPNQRTKELLQGQFIDIKRVVADRAFSKEVEAGVSYSLSTYQKLADTYGNIVLDNPEEYERYSTKLADYLTGLPNIPASKREEIGMKAKENLARLAVEADIADPRRAKSTLDKASDTVVSKVTYDKEAVWPRMIQTESAGKQLDKNGNPTTSTAGAVGIAQVMPGTAKETAQRHGIPWSADKWKFDAEYNENLGRLYFEQMLAQFGDMEKAVAAYNAGPGGVQRAMMNAAINKTDWRAELPTETKGYLKKVLGVSVQSNGTVIQLPQSGVKQEIRKDAPDISNLPAAYKDLSPEARLSAFEKLKNAVLRGNAEEKSALEYDISNAEELIKRNVLPDTGALTQERFMVAYGEKAGTEVFKQFQTQTNELKQALEIADGMQKLPSFSALKTDEEKASYFRVQERAAKIIENRAADPMAYEISKRGLDPVDFSSPENVAAQLQERAKVLRASQDTYGAQPYLLSGAEAQFTVEQLAEQSPKAALVTLHAAVGALSYRDTEGLTNSLADHSAVTAVATRLLSNAEHLATGQGKNELTAAAGAILEGAAILKADPKAFSKISDATDEKLSERIKKAAPEIFSQYQDASKSATRFSELQASVKAYLVAQAAQGKDINTGAIESAVALINGKKISFRPLIGDSAFAKGGKTTMPPGMEEKTFREKINAKTRELFENRTVDLAGRKVLPNLVPVRGGNSTYYFVDPSTNTVQINPATGELYVIDIGE